MSPGMKTALMWLAVILLAAYLMNVNVASFVGSVLHAAQAVHNQNAHP